MRRIRRLAAPLVLGAALLCLAAGIAAANRFEISNAERGFRLRWTSIKFIVAEKTVDCEVRINGSFHSRVITKTAGLLIGYVTEASFINLCTGGEGRFLTESLPWHLRYAAFTGTLPRIGSVVLQIIGLRALILPTGGVSCLLTTTATNPLVILAIVEPTEPTFQSVKINETIPIPLTGMMCPGSATMGGEGIPTSWAEIASIIIRLI
jgi:hypothetical protein